MASTRLLEMKFYSLLLTSIIIIGIILSSTVASLNSSVRIPNSFTIAAILPLHVVGRYIKDINNNTVVLRGVDKVEFADQPGGTWMGIPIYDYAGWNASKANILAELIAMKSWGINVIRCHQAVEQWVYNMGNNRQIIESFLDMTAQVGIYVIFDAYSIDNYADSAGAAQDPLPWPPYALAPNASQVIPSQAAFVDYWVSVATALKSYPNVIFELWNEPTNPGGYTLAEIEPIWFNVSQWCINSIRATGATNLIIFQWEMGSYANLDFPADNAGSSVGWITDYPLTDPTGNLVYSTHIYRLYGGTGLYSLSGSQTEWNSSKAWDYNEIVRAFQIEKLDWVGNTLNKPLLIGETGADIAWTGTELTHELVAWNNTVTIFNEWGLSYLAFWWRDIGVFALLQNGRPWVPPPTTSGQTLINALK